MAFKLGGTAINKVYLGATEMNKVYLGSTVVYEVSAGGGLPVLESFSTVGAVSGGGVAVDKPAGTTSGDMLLALFSSDSVAENHTLTGFTEIFVNVPDASSSTSFSAWYKIAGGSEPTTYTASTSTSEAKCFAMLRISGASGIDVSATLGVNASATGVTVGALTTTVDNTLLISFAHHENTNLSFNAYPSGYTEVAEFDSSPAFVNGPQMAVYRKDQATAGSTGNATFGWSSAESGCGAIIAVKG
jgi:hypothetical protein